jgi:type I restriction enzyme S subunit
MGSKTIPVKLKDICTKIGSGATPRGGKESYYTSGISLIRSQNVLDFAFSYDGLAFINDEQATQLNNVTVQEKDVLINITGDSVARACIVPKEVLPARVNQHVSIIRPNSRADGKYILYFLQHEKPHLLSIGSCGGTRNALTKEMLENLELDLPALEQQKKISATLSCLDDKIELNNRIIANLEAQAQAIFKSWFVDFEPFQDDEFEESELGLIPKGWRVVPFTEMVRVLGGGTPKTDIFDNWNGDIPFFTPKDAGSTTYILRTEKTLTQKGLNSCNSGLYPENTVFVTARGTVGKIALAGKPMAMNQSCYALVGKYEISQYFVYHLTKNTVERLKGKASGAVFDAIVTRDFDSELIIAPIEGTIVEFAEIMESLYQQMLCLEKQNIVLRTTRDTLLPKLMTGEIEVPVEG